MRNLALTIILLALIGFAIGAAYVTIGVLAGIGAQLHRSNDLREKEQVIREIETVATFCESRSGKVRYNKNKGLDCNEVQPTLDIEPAIVEL